MHENEAARGDLQVARAFFLVTNGEKSWEPT